MSDQSPIETPGNPLITPFIVSDPAVRTPGLMPMTPFPGVPVASPASPASPSPLPGAGADPDLLERLCRVVAAQMSIEADMLTVSTGFVADLTVDSMDFFEILIAIEDEFGVSISDPEAEACATIGDMADLISGKLAAKGGE